MEGVRLAHAGDIMTIVGMVEELREAVDGLVPVSRPYTAQVLAGLISDPRGVVFVSDGGFVAGSVQPLIINPVMVAMEHGWFARDRSGLALLRAFETWAADQGAEMVKLSTGASGPDLGRIGYTMTEQNWVRCL